MSARDLDAFRLRHAYFPLDFHRHREDYPRADNAMSLLIGLESVATPDRPAGTAAALAGAAGAGTGADDAGVDAAAAWRGQ